MATSGGDGAVLVANKSFIVWDQGRMLRFIRNRTTIREGHRLLAGRGDRFVPLTVDFDIAQAPRSTTSARSGGL